MAMDKRTWVNIAAGTVAVIAIIFGAKQCSDKQGAMRENERCRDVAVRIDSAATRIGRGIDDLRKDNGEIKDLIEAHDEIVNEKLDTLKAHCDKMKPCDCNGDAKACACKPGCDCCKCKPAKPAKPQKPRTSRPTQPATPVVTQPTTPVAEQKPAETVRVVADKDSVVVTTTRKPDQAVIVNGDNNGVVIVNSNGVVNANGNINGNNNTVNSIVMGGASNQRCGTSARIVLGRSKCR